MLLSLSHVSKVYGTLRALDDFCLDVPEGEWLSIVGSSGSGKTTAMNIIGCMDSPSEGKVLLEGRDLAALDASQLTTVRTNVIGLVFQQFHLVPHLTALENVMVAQYYHSKTDKNEALAALADVGLAEVAPSAVSLGQDQGYIALSLDTPASEVARWRAALAQLNRDGRYRQLYDHYAH